MAVTSSIAEPATPDQGAPGHNGNTPDAQRFSAWNYLHDLAKSDVAARVGRGAYTVLQAIAVYADKDGRCYPGHQRIAERTGMSVRMVIYHIQTLEACRAFKIEHRLKDGSKEPDTNRYILLPLEGITPDPRPPRPAGRSCRSKTGGSATGFTTSDGTQTHEVVKPVAPGSETRCTRGSETSFTQVVKPASPKASQGSIPELSTPGKHPIIGASQAPRGAQSSTPNGTRDQNVQTQDAVAAHTQPIDAVRPCMPSASTSQPASPAPPAPDEPPAQQAPRAKKPRAKKPTLAEREPELAAARDKAVAYWEQKTEQPREGGTLKQAEAVLRKHSLDDVVGTIDDLWDQVDGRGELTNFWRQGNLSWAVIARSVAAHTRGDLTCLRTYKLRQEAQQGGSNGRYGQRPQPQSFEDIQAEQKALRGRACRPCGNCVGQEHETWCPSGLGGQPVLAEQECVRPPAGPQGPGLATIPDAATAPDEGPPTRTTSAAEVEEVIAYWEARTGNQRKENTPAEVAALLAREQPADLTGTIDDLWNALKANGEPDPFWQQRNYLSWKAIGVRVALHKAGSLNCRRTPWPVDRRRVSAAAFPTPEEIEEQKRAAAARGGDYWCRQCKCMERAYHEADCPSGLGGQVVTRTEAPACAPVEQPAGPTPQPTAVAPASSPSPPLSSSSAAPASAPPTPVVAVPEHHPRTPQELTADLVRGLAAAHVLHPHQIGELQGLEVRRWDAERLVLAAPTPQVKHAAKRYERDIDKYLRRSHRLAREIEIQLAVAEGGAA